MIDIHALRLGDCVKLDNGQQVVVTGFRRISDKASWRCVKCSRRRAEFVQTTTEWGGDSDHLLLPPSAIIERLPAPSDIEPELPPCANPDAEIG